MNTYKTGNQTTERKTQKLTLPLLERNLDRASDQLRSKMDASEYKKLLLGLFFLKRISDLFDERYQRIIGEAKECAEDPHSYTNSIFVPKAARWEEIRVAATSRDGVTGRLNKAMRQITKANECLADVLAHIDFGHKFGKLSIADQTLSELILQLSQLRLRDEDLSAIPDLLGTIYDHLIRDYSSSRGRTSGEFYTPTTVARVLVRLLKPAKNMRLYDPCVGSGGLLIEATRFLRERGEKITSVSFYGQEKNAETWALCKMNMLMQGTPSAIIENDDTLLHPRHIDADGQLTRFDAIISNPPFGANYDTEGMEFPKRFLFHCPQAGKRGDLMFIQHMLSVLRPDGTIVTVMPHGVLFRDGVEREIRRWLIQDVDAIEAVIGLPEGLFYGTGIATCILVLRGLSAKTGERRGKILFIRAEDEYGKGRGQNELRSEDREKIVDCFERFNDVPGYARVVHLEEVVRNDFNLNIGRYIERPVPPPPDVRGLLIGAVSRKEVRASEGLFIGHGLPIQAIFVERDAAYYEFVSDLTERWAIPSRVHGHPEVRAKEAWMMERLGDWWRTEGTQLPRVGLRRLASIREGFKGTLEQAVASGGPLDDLEVAGIFAHWWEAHLEDLLLLAKYGGTQVIQGWISPFGDTLEEQDHAHYLGHGAISPLLTNILPAEVAQITEQQATIGDLERQVTEWEMGEDGENLQVEDATESTPHYSAHDLQQQLAAIKEAIRRHEPTRPKGNRVQPPPADAREATGQGNALFNLRGQRDALELTLAPYLESKIRLRNARKDLRTLQEALIAHLLEQIRGSSPTEQDDLVLTILGEDLQTQFASALAAHRRKLVRTIENWFDTYHEGIQQIEVQRKAAEQKLDGLLRGLGYF